MSKNSTVIERRLRPIYDFLDIGNPKRALQEAEKLLKRQHDLLSAKALKVLALIRLGRTNEITELLNEVEAVDSDDEYTLQALTYCYRDLGKSSKIITLYERALKKQPQNEEFMSHVMMAYARIGEHKQQSHFAMQLYKLRPTKSFYYFWAVMATVMQAYDSENTRNVYLTLAERMVKKFMNENKITAEAEVKLYCMILNLLGKYDEAAALLRSELSTSLIKNNQEKRQNLIELYEKLERFDEIYEICTNSLKEDVDDWFLWNNLIKSGLEMIRRNPENKSTIVDEITQLILKNVEFPYGSDEKSSGKMRNCRAPYLARLRLIVCLLEQELVVRSELGTSSLGEPGRLILEYFRRYSDKPCCFDDIKCFLFLLGEQQQDDFIRQVEEICGGLSTSPEKDLRFAQNVTQLRRHVTALRLCRCLGRYRNLSMDDKIIFAKDLVARYLHGLHFGVDLLTTDIQFSDDYLLFAVPFMWEIYIEQGEAFLLHELILILEFASNKSQANFHLKYVLSKIFPLIGAGDCLYQTVESLRIKYVMHETLWYLIADQLSPWGLYQNISQWSSSAISFVSQSDREIIDNVIQCYKSGSFSRIIEFMEFRDKLKKSFHNRACLIWRRYFTLIVECSNIETIKANVAATGYDDEIIWSNLVDNRDFRSFKLWEPEYQNSIESDERFKRSYQELVDQLRFYHQINRLFCVVCDEDELRPVVVEENGAASSTERTEESLKQVGQKFSTILSQLKAHRRQCYDEYRNDDGDPPSSVFGPPADFFGVYLRGGYFDALTCVFDVVGAILKTTNAKGSSGTKLTNGEVAAAGGDDSPSTDVEEKSENAVKFPTKEDLQAMLRVMFSHHQLQESCFGFPHMQICHVSFLVQTLSLILAMLVLVKNILEPTTAAGLQKAKKKKKAAAKNATTNSADSASDNHLLNEFLKFAEVFCEAAATSGRLISDLELILDTDMPLLTLNEPKIAPESLVGEIRMEFWAKLKASYVKSLKCLSQIVAQQSLAAKGILKQAF